MKRMPEFNENMLKAMDKLLSADISLKLERLRKLEVLHHCVEKFLLESNSLEAFIDLQEAFDRTTK